MCLGFRLFAPNVGEEGGGGGRLNLPSEGFRVDGIAAYQAIGVRPDATGTDFRQTDVIICALIRVRYSSTSHPLSVPPPYGNKKIHRTQRIHTVLPYMWSPDRRKTADAFRLVPPGSSTAAYICRGLFFSCRA